MPRTRVGYRLHHDKDDNAVVWVYEDPALVLLGGEVWPASFLVAEHLASFLGGGSPHDAGSEPSSLTIVELGAGTGLCGLVALATALESFRESVHCFLADEAPALCEVNLRHYAESSTTWQHAKSRESTSFPSSFPSPSSTFSIASTLSSNGSSPSSLHALDLPWGGCPRTLPLPLTKACQSSRQVVIVGCEVTPMLQTQTVLIETMHALLMVSSSPAAGLSSSPSSSSPPSSRSFPTHTTTPSSASSSSSPAALSFPPTSAVAIMTIDACVSGTTYPPACPHPKPCAGHRFLQLVEGHGGMMWEVKGVWTAAEVQEACRRRRVVLHGSEANIGDGSKIHGGGSSSSSCSRNSRDFAVTAPEGLVIVHVRSKV